jgi:hypothetical protein
MLRTSSLALYVLALTASSAAFADGSWVNIASTDGNAAGLSNIPGVPSDAQWVPNQFNNPVIGPTGIVTFRGQLAGTGIQATAPNNSHIFVSGSTGGAGLSQIARAGNALPSNLAPGLICNTTSGTNGLGSTQFEAGNGGILITGNLNGTGVTSTTSPFWMWRDSTGASNSILYRGGDVFNGLTMSVSAGSPQYVNNDGKALVYSTFSGAGVVTTGTAANNGAVMWMGPSGKSIVLRKGDAAPGFTDGTVIVPDTFGLQVNGNGVVLTGKLAAASGITTSNDSVYMTNAWSGSLQIFARKGGVIPGYPDLTFANLTTPTSAPITFAARPLMDDGTIVFRSNLGGAGATAGVNDVATFAAKNGTCTMWMRKGDAVPGVSDAVFSSVGSSSQMNNNGVYAFEGILCNADGTSIANDPVTGLPVVGASFIGIRKANGTLQVIARQFDAVPGISGATFSALAGSSALSLGDSGVLVFSNNVVVPGSASNSAVFAWDATLGLRVIAKPGDTNFTGTPANQFTQLGSTAVTGAGVCSTLNAKGQFVFRAGDSVNQIYTIAKIDLGPAPCPADLTGDGVVNGADIAALLGAWGPCSGSCPADLTGDGVVNGADLAALLGAWGDCPN